MKFKKKSGLFAAAFLLLSGSLYAQQATQYSMYMLNNYTLNPAVAGTENFTDLKASTRLQWVGGALGADAPKTYYATGHTALGKQSSGYDDVRPVAHHGVGGQLMQSVTGPTSLLGVYGSYSYHLPLSSSLTLSLGVNLGLKQFSIDGNKLRTTDPNDQAISGYKAAWAPDGGLGAWLYHKKFYVGLSSLQIFNNKISVSEVANSALGAGNLNRHYFGTAGYRFKLNDDWTLVPSVLVKGVYPAPVQFDFNAKLRYNDIAYAGVSYRNQESVIGLIGFVIRKQIEVAYSYDFNVSGLQTYQNGSHEFLLGYRIPKKGAPLPPAQFW